jgi:ketosteroid isomerase-like protein
MNRQSGSWTGVSEYAVTQPECRLDACRGKIYLFIVGSPLKFLSPSWCDCLREELTSMNRFMQLALLLMLVPFVASGQEANNGKKGTIRTPNSAKVQALITKMENDRIQAGVRKDVDKIAAVTADDYVMIDFDGKVRNKAATLERIKSSEIQLRSKSLDELDVRIYGNTAIVTGRTTPKGTISGKDFSRPIRYTRVYVKKNEHWQVVSFQQTRVVQDQ